MAKSRAELGDEEEGMEKVIIGGDLRQEKKRRRAEERKVKGTGVGQTMGRSWGMMAGARRGKQARRLSSMLFRV